MDTWHPGIHDDDMTPRGPVQPRFFVQDTPPPIGGPDGAREGDLWACTAPPRHRCYWRTVAILLACACVVADVTIIIGWWR